MKTVLVIDMPESCCNCKFYRFVHQDDWDRTETICIILGKMHDNGIDSKPSWCPLKPLPEKRILPEYQTRGTNYGEEPWFSDGWNACLYKITGEDNG